MKMSRFASILALASALLAAIGPSVVRADPEPEVSSDPAESAAATPRDLWDRLLAVEVTGGIDTPYGLVGGAVVVTPWRHLQLDLGGGVSRDGGRVAGGARFLLPHANGAFGMRVGFAGGPLTWDTPVHATNVEGDEGATEGNAHLTWDFVGFVDLSLSLEVRFDAGVYLRFQFGVEHALAGADRCVESHGGVETGACSVAAYQPTRSYVGLALGYAFDL